MLQDFRTLGLDRHSLHTYRHQKIDLHYTSVFFFCVGLFFEGGRGWRLGYFPLAVG